MIALGLLLMLVGGLLVLLGFLFKIGPIPGDIYIKRDNFVVYVPVLSAIVLSVVLSCALSLLGRLLR